MNQQILKENKTLNKAHIIAASKRVRRSRIEENRNVWMVGLGNPWTPNRFYKVEFDDTLDAFVCECKAFEFNKFGEACPHILAAAIYEGGV